MKRSKAQSAVEFIVLAAFMLLVIVGFFAISSTKLIETKEEENKKIAEDIASIALREIEIAKSVNDGYVRLLSLPRKVNGVNYTIKIIDNRELVVDYLGYEYVNFLPANVSGSINNGLNEIKKIDGIIYINIVKPQCSNGIDDIDSDTFIDAGDPDCYASCDYLNPSKYDEDGYETDVCSCSSLGTCCSGIGVGNHYSLFDSGCGTGQCWTFCIVPLLTMKSDISRAIRFDNDGNVTLRGTLQQNVASPSITSDDEFIFKDTSGNAVAVVNLNTGNIEIKGSLYQNQSSLTPSPSSNEIILQASNGNAVAYIDEAGDLRIKGTFTENGNP